ncbi:MAG: hypothetical protein HC840_01440 [Leptolyngbyaceae cyanobacterium RM2_2_4]|nr:hypothetical protein [Leptolyngbyaceae cyanobacterium RM2_2_4]
MRILRLQQLAYSSLGCLALILGTASAGLAQSCPGFIDVPLTKNRLNQIAAINGIPFNQIGKAFENFALATIDPNAPIPSNTKRFPSTERGAATDGEFQNVIPDGIFPLTVKQPGAPDLIFNESVFYEAKALQPQSITPEYPVNPNDEDGDTGRYQILGFLDALRNSPAGQGGTGIPALIFLTTSGVTVDFETRAEAFSKGLPFGNQLHAKQLDLVRLFR